MKLVEVINRNRLEEVKKCVNISEECRKKLESYPMDGIVKYVRKNNIGRYYGNGMQNMKREIRKYIADGKYVDIDISNCHPCILSDLLEKYSISVPKGLKEYNEDRESKMKEYGFKSKQDIFNIIYNEQYKGKNKELRELHDVIYKKLLLKLHENYVNIYKNIEEKENKSGSFVSLVLQDIENDILMVIYEKCKKLKMKVGVLVFDGLMIEKESYKEENLKKLEETVLKKLNNRIKLVEKKMDIDWMPEMENVNVKEEVERETKEYIEKNYNDNVDEISLEENKIMVKANTGIYFQCDCKNGSYILSNEGSYTLCNNCNKRFPPNTVLKINEEYKNVLKYFQIVANQVNININNVVNEEDNVDDIDNIKIIEDDTELDLLMKRNLKFQSNVTLLKIVKYYIKKYEYMNNVYDYKYIGMKENNHLWYKWTGEKWNMESTGSPKMPKIYEMIRNDYEKALNKTDKINLKQILKKTCKTCGDSNTFGAINNTWMYEYPPEKDGDEIFDMNPYLIGFNNGVYDFKNKVFRKQSKEDYVSMSVGYDYNVLGNGKRELILEFFESIIPNEDNRIFLLKTLASCLVGINKEERLGIFTGSSRNGKGVLSELMEHTLGDYYGAGSGSFIQSERPSCDKPQPDLINLRKKRLVILNEIDEKKNLNIQFTKNLVGNDIIPCRSLFSNIEMQVRAQFKLILNCNQRPIMDADRKDLWSKVYLLEFPITFVDSVKDIKNENYKLKNNNLKSILKSWNVDMMNILIEYYNIYEIEGVLYTDSIIKTVEMEKENNDEVQEFINNNIEKMDGYRLMMSDVLNLYEEKNGRLKPQDRKKLKNKFLEKLDGAKFKSRSYYWNNYRFVESDNIIED